MDRESVRVQASKWNPDQITVCVTMLSYRPTERTRVDRHVIMTISYVRIGGKCVPSGYWGLQENYTTKKLDKRFGDPGLASMLRSGLSAEQVERDFNEIKQSDKFKKQLKQRTKYTENKITSLKQRLKTYERITKEIEITV